MRVPADRIRNVYPGHVLLRCTTLAGYFAATAVAAWSAPGEAATLRIQVDQRGDFALIGNTLGFDCSAGTPMPVVGMVGDCGVSTEDDTPDVFWRADEPAPGAAIADHSIDVSQARSSAVLQLPPGATVTAAFLYWAARQETVLMADADASLERPGIFSQVVTAIESALDPQFPIYQSVADVTALVQQHGTGMYRVGDVSAMSFVDLGDNVQFAAWSLVVFYQVDTEPPRNLALFDGLDLVGDASGKTISLSGFLVPDAAFDGKLGVVAYEGDNQGVGDQLQWDGNALENALNPSANFFNSTRSFLGVGSYVPGDLPQLTGTAQSTAGLDMDVVDIQPFLSPLQTSAIVHASTAGESYWIGAFITSVSTYKPDFTGSTKEALDLDAGAVLAGDEVEYTIVVTNDGSDASVDTVLTDPLPAEVALMPESVAITAGPNAGTKTDAASDDQAEYDAANHTLTLRLGSGANATQGGSLSVGESTAVVFRVTIDPAASGTVENQATINAAGAQGSPSEATVTDGNGPAPGSPPTIVVIEDGGAAGGRGGSGGAPAGTGAEPPVAAQSSAVGSGGASDEDELGLTGGSLRGGGCGCVVSGTEPGSAAHLLLTSILAALSGFRRRRREWPSRC